MKKQEIITALKRTCTCYFDAGSGELWKCVSCDARDYIQLLSSRLKEIGCSECDVQIKELLK